MSEEKPKTVSEPPSLLESAAAPPVDPKEPPSAYDRDFALGRFMDAWSELEASLRNLLHVLSQASSESAFSIAAAVPDLRQMKELLEALGRLYLGPEDQTELEAITKYLLISAQYRNSIVHGQWGLTSNRERVTTRGVVHEHMWIRIYTLVDKSKGHCHVAERGTRKGCAP